MVENVSPVHRETGYSFSVVIATYNARDYVVEAVRSILDQTHPASEIIIVIDGSTDDTAIALHAQFPSVIVIEQENRGKGIARNTGIERATGEWICFLDHDDLWHKDLLKETYSYLTAHPECQAVRAPVWFFRDSPQGPSSSYGARTDFTAKDLEECHRAVADGDPSVNATDYLNICGNSFPLMLEGNRGALSTTVVKRAVVIRAGGFCPAQTNGEDWTLFLNVSRICEWHLIGRRLAFMRLHSRQDSQTLSCGLIALAGQINAWFTGRPLVHHVVGLQFLRELSKYGVIYRRMIQEYLWEALRKGQGREALLIRACSRLLLPRWIDRVYVHLPPPITWRWEKYVLGKYR